MNTLPRVLSSSVAALLALAASHSHAGLVTYSVDANTLQLWHLDEAAGASQTVGLGSFGGNAFAVDNNPVAITPPVVTTVLGAAGFAGFGNAANISAQDLLLGFDGNASGAFDGDLNGDQVALSSLGIGGVNPFTLEAMINPASAAGNREIIATDSSGATRGFQFRLTTGGSTGQRLEFNLIGSAGAQRFAEIPVAGTDAFATGSWFHAAFTFDGTNAQFYWTKVDSSASIASALGAPQAITISDAAGAITGPLAFGNESRAVSGEGVLATLDEIRISNIARSATQFIFTSTGGSFWNNAGSGNWDALANWTAGVPNVTGAVASFGGGGTEITAPATVTIDGTKTVGSLTFGNATNSFTLSSGTAGALALDNGPTPASITVTAGTYTVSVPISLSAAGATFTVASGADKLIIRNVISGTAPFAKGGAGTLEIADGGALPPGDVTIAAGTLSINKSTPTSLANNISGSGAIAQNGAGTLTLTGTNSHSGGNTLNVGAIIVGNPSALGAAGPLTVNAGLLDLNGNSPIVGALAGTGGTISDNMATPGISTLTVGSAAITTFEGTITNGANRTLALVRNGTGTLTLTKANTYSGGTTINGGIIAAANNAALGTGPIVLAPGAVRLLIADGVTISNPITIDGGTPGVGLGLLQGSGTGTSTLSGPITINALSTNGGHFVGGGGTLLVDGPITALVAVTVRAGTTIFSGGGNYSLIQLTDFPKIGANNGLSTSAVAEIAVSGNTTFDLNGFNQSLAGLLKTNANAGTVTNFGATPSTLTLAPIAPQLFNGTISGNIALKISGTDTQTFSGQNDYLGDTTITSGTLAVSGAISGTPVVDVSVGANLDVSGVVGGFVLGAAQTLKGGGNVLGSATILGTLAPGAGIATLNFNSDLTLSGIADFEINKTGPNRTSDLANVTGALTYGGILNVAAYGAAPASGDLFNLFDAASFTGDFSSMNLPVLDAGLSWNTSLLNVNGTLAVVPEPGAAFLLVGACGLVTGWRRRR